MSILLENTKYILTICNKDFGGYDKHRNSFSQVIKAIAIINSKLVN
jgi:hypothetical protein